MLKMEEVMNRSLAFKAGIAAGVVLIGLVLSGIVWVSCSSNPETHAGYVGYLTQGAVFGKTHYVGMQKGPTSPGRTWMLDVVNVSITPYTYTEEFDEKTAVQAKDKLRLTFQVHLIWQVDADKVKVFVEKFSYLQSDKNPDKVVRDAYENFLKESLRTFAREEVQKYDALDAPNHLEEIGQAISAKVETVTKDTPFRVTNVRVGNIQPPKEVTDSIAKKVAVTQDLERKQTENEIAEKERLKRVIEARGIAQAMEIIHSKLTPMYIQHEAIEAQRAMVGSPNHTTIYIPVGNNGVPLVGTFDAGAHRKKE